MVTGLLDIKNIQGYGLGTIMNLIHHVLSLADFRSSYPPEKNVWESIYFITRMQNLPKEIRSDIQDVTPLMMIHVADEFLRHPPKSQYMKVLWTEIIFLSFFRGLEREYLHELHTNEAHDNTLHAIANFHMHNSKLREGSHWIGGLKHSPRSLSQEIPKVETYVDKLHDLYPHYTEILYSKSFRHSNYVNSGKLYKCFVGMQ